jgi:hypothetical protein
MRTGLLLLRPAPLRCAFRLADARCARLLAAGGVVPRPRMSVAAVLLLRPAPLRCAFRLADARCARLLAAGGFVPRPRMSVAAAHGASSDILVT